MKSFIITLLLGVVAAAFIICAGILAAYLIWAIKCPGEFGKRIGGGRDGGEEAEP